MPTIVAGLPDELARCATWDGGHGRTPDDLLSWNLGRARAAEVESAGAGEARPVGCP